MAIYECIVRYPVGWKSGYPKTAPSDDASTEEHIQWQKAVLQWEAKDCDETRVLTRAFQFRFVPVVGMILRGKHFQLPGKSKRHRRR